MWLLRKPKCNCLGQTTSRKFCNCDFLLTSTEVVKIQCFSCLSLPKPFTLNPSQEPIKKLHYGADFPKFLHQLVRRIGGTGQVFIYELCLFFVCVCTCPNWIPFQYFLFGWQRRCWELVNRNCWVTTDFTAIYFILFKLLLGAVTYLLHSPTPKVGHVAHASIVYCIIQFASSKAS